MQNNSVISRKLAVGIKELQQMLGLGRANADAIGEKAGAVIRVGTTKQEEMNKIKIAL